MWLFENNDVQIINDYGIHFFKTKMTAKVMHNFWPWDKTLPTNPQMHMSSQSIP